MVDLARSVNLPLLHTRAPDDFSSGDLQAHFLSRTHGGLMYGWGGSKPRILWHTDEVCANPGRICFPLDPGTGALAGSKVAAQLYVDEYWATPARLKQAGFLYRRQHVLPGRAPGLGTRGSYEDRVDFGWMCGQWNHKGSSDIGEIQLLNHNYALGGAPLLQLAASHVVVAQLTSNLQQWMGGFSADELPQVRPVQEYAARAETIVKLLGGPAQLKHLIAQAKANMGQDLLPDR